MAEPDIKDGCNLERRKKKVAAANIVDRIGALPDEILVSILSLLSLKEAQATCILSRRWQHVWTHGTTLNFDADEQVIRFCKLRRKAERDPERSKYVEWVDRVLKQHRTPNIEQFRVSFDLGRRGSGIIDEWIRFAMRKGVQNLELDFSVFLRRSTLNYKISNKVLGIGQSSPSKPLCSEYTGFKFLKDLVFRSVDVDQDIVEYFISNSRVLERRLVVYHSCSLANLRVVGHSIALKHLVIQQCPSIKSIEICETNLVSFTYDGNLANLLLRNVPLLVEVSLSGCSLTIDFCYLSCCLSQLKILKLNYKNLWLNTDPVIPSLPNLKCLELAFEEHNKCALLHLAFYIKQTPRLHTLVLKLNSRSWNKNNSPFVKKRAARCSHDCLKVVELIEYCGVSRQTELVKYLPKMACNLEKIIFNPVVDSWRSRFDKLLDLSAVYREDSSRAQARRLKEKLPATLEVVCL